MLKGNGGKYNCGISMENARKVLRVSFLFQTPVARPALHRRSSLLADSVLIAAPATSGIARTPSSPTRENAGSARQRPEHLLPCC